MHKKILLFVVICFSFNIAFSKNTPPKLVVFIHIDQLTTNQLQRFHHSFSDIGFNMLTNKGAYYTSTYYDVFSSYKGTKLATLYTGTAPSTHGIIGSSWYKNNTQEESKAFNFHKTNDYFHPDSGIINYPKFYCSNITDLIKHNSNEKSKIASVGATPEDVAFDGYVDKNLSFWFDTSDGNIISNADIDSNAWVNNFNNMNFADIYINKEWTPIKDISKYYDYKKEKSKKFKYKFNKSDDKYRPYKNFIFSPFVNTLLRDFAANMIVNEKLGQRETTDVLSIHFKAKAFNSNNCETFKMENEDMLIRLDRNIAELLETINLYVGLQNSLIILSSTPNNYRKPQSLENHNVDSGYFSGKKACTLLNLYFMAKYGQGKWIKGYKNRQIYINKKLIENKKLDYNSIFNDACSFLIDMAGVDKVISENTIRNMDSKINRFISIQNNYFYGRSGDIFIELKPNWTEEIKNHKEKFIIPAKNYSSPLIIFGKDITPQIFLNSIDMKQLAPSIAAKLKLPKLNGANNSNLLEIIKK